MNDDMKRLCREVSDISDHYGRPTDDQTDEAIVRAVLNELVGITRRDAESGSIHSQQVHQYTTMAVASILGLTHGR